MKAIIVTIILTITILSGCQTPNPTPYYPQRSATRPHRPVMGYPATPVYMPIVEQTPCQPRRESAVNRMIQFEMLEDLGRSNRPYQFPVNQRDFYAQ